MSEKALVFISCGQFTPAERKLGTAIAAMVKQETGAEGYFAQNQSSLEGLSNYVFDALHRAAGFIAVMHHRGRVFDLSGKADLIRGSVWVEQEIAIAGFLQATRGGDFPVAAYVQKGITLEGAREKLILNPMEFTRHPEIMKDLKAKLQGWALKPRRPERATVDLVIDGIKTRTSMELHEHELKVVMTNTSNLVISDWIASLEMPARFVPANVVIRPELREKATRDYRFFRDGNSEGPLLPGDSRRILPIPYQITTDIEFKHQGDFDRLVKVDVYVSGQQAGSASRPFREIQNF